jgi:hypothetical protein
LTLATHFKDTGSQKSASESHMEFPEPAAQGWPLEESSRQVPSTPGVIATDESKKQNDPGTHWSEKPQGCPTAVLAVQVPVELPVPADAGEIRQ